MRIDAGTVSINAKTLIGGPVTYNGHIVDSIQIGLDQDITQEQIDVLSSTEWNVYDDAGVFQSKQTGFNTMHQYAITFLKVPDLVKENEELKAALAAKEAELQATLAQVSTTEVKEEPQS
jgi:hypothetical protein